MTQYEAFDPDVTVHARTILTVVDDTLARFSEEYRRQARETLADNGVVDPAPEEWYSQQAWLNTFESLADELEPHILDRLGEQTYDAADWPTGISGVEEGCVLSTPRISAITAVRRSDPIASRVSTIEPGSSAVRTRTRVPSTED